jgi:hypothetical protein
MVLKPIGLTFMQYEEGNLLSLALAYASLFPIFIVVGFAAVLFVRRELHTGTFFVGQLACEVLTILLKSVIKEPRPPGKEYIISNTISLQTTKAKALAFVVCNEIVLEIAWQQVADDRSKDVDYNSATESPIQSGLSW